MVQVYVLLSLLDGATYVGMTMNLVRRLKEHNGGSNRYTKGHRPWKVIYTESHVNWSEARIREKFFKTTTGKSYLKEIGILI